MAYAMGRTPDKPQQEPANLDREETEVPLLADMEEPVDVRRLTGEWEKGFKPTAQSKMVSPPPKTRTTVRPKQTPPKNTASTVAKMTSAPVKAKTKEAKEQPSEPKPPSTRRPSVEASVSSGETGGKYISRLTEAKAMMAKVRTQLNSSRNTSRAIIKEVMDATERLLQLVGEAEADRRSDQRGIAPNNTKRISGVTSEKQDSNRSDMPGRDELILTKIEENTRLLKENEQRTIEIRQMLEEQKENAGKATYAQAVTEGIKPQTESKAKERKSLHSIVVTSKNVLDTGEEVLERIRKAVEAKEGWIKVEKVRKAKDSKIIMGCSTMEDRIKIKNKIEKAGQSLVVEDMLNRDPLLVLKDVLIMHSDEEIVRALRNQNREVFHGLDDKENRVAVKFRKKSRNPHTSHIVLTLSPTLWGRATEQGRLRIDLQNVFVEDQSPLVQCSKCLGYGHGRRFCQAPADLCSHCGGPHHSKDCPDKVLGEPPQCINCKRASSDKISHNAFSRECPVRKKWDSIARSSTQYC